MAKLAAKSARVLEYLQQHDQGEGVSVDEIAEALSTDAAPVTKRNIIPVISLSLGKALKDGSRGVLAKYEKREENGEMVGYAVLTDEGVNYDLDAEEE